MPRSAGGLALVVAVAAFVALAYLRLSAVAAAILGMVGILVLAWAFMPQAPAEGAASRAARKGRIAWWVAGLAAAAGVGLAA